MVEIPVQNIKPNPRQPRQKFDPQELAGLANSLQEHGIIQPLIVSQGAQPREYILVAGERRLLAARLVGMEVVPALIRETSDQQRLEIALVENVQRADLGPLETAEAYRQLAEDFGLSHEEIGTRVGKSRVAVTNTLRLFQLPPSIQQALTDGDHPRRPCPRFVEPAHSPKPGRNPGHCSRQAIERAPDRRPGPQVEPATNPLPRPDRAPDPEIKAIEERLQSRLGTRVTLRHGRKAAASPSIIIRTKNWNSLLGLFQLED